MNVSDMIENGITLNNVYGYYEHNICKCIVSYLLTTPTRANLITTSDFVNSTVLFHHP